MTQVFILIESSESKCSELGWHQQSEIIGVFASYDDATEYSKKCRGFENAHWEYEGGILYCTEKISGPFNDDPCKEMIMHNIERWEIGQTIDTLNIDDEEGM